MELEGGCGAKGKVWSQREGVELEGGCGARGRELTSGCIGKCICMGGLYS